MLKISDKNKFCNFFLKKIINNLDNSKELFFINNNEKYDYKFLKELILRFQPLLRKIKSKRIMVFSDKSIYYYAIVLSLALSGKTWIQISPNIPLERIKRIIKLSKCKYAIYDKSFGSPVNLRKLKIKILESNKIEEQVPDDEVKLKRIKHDDLAMIFFTSGSTSEPKGVKISFLNFIYCAYHQIKNLNYMKNKNIFADYHDTTFVMSLVVIFPALFTNSAISPLVNYNDKIYPIDHIKNNKISVLITVPSFFIYISNFLKKKLFVNQVIFCGENFSYNVFDLFLKKIKFNNLFNCYGSTELSPWAFFYKFNAKDYNLIKKNNQVPIGKIYKGLKCFINYQKELCISGNIVAEGYLKKSQNIERFFVKNKIKYYNTGDICKKIGSNYFITGRNDKQIKIKGYRINTLEIENITKKLKEIEFVICFKKKKEDKLVLVIISRKKKLQKKIENQLKNNLPNYMVPEEIYFHNKINLNKNGKVNSLFYKNKYS